MDRCDRLIASSLCSPLSTVRPYAAACNHRVGVYDWDPAFDDGAKITDLSTFEIVSQSDAVRFLHAHRNDPRATPLMALTVRKAGLLRAQRGGSSGGGGHRERDQRDEPSQTAATVVAAAGL